MTTRHRTIHSDDASCTICTNTESCKRARKLDRQSTKITLRGSFMYIGKIPAIVKTFIEEAGLEWARPPRVEKVLGALNFEVCIDGEADAMIFDEMRGDYRQMFTEEHITVEASRCFVCVC